EDRQPERRAHARGLRRGTARRGARVRALREQPPRPHRPRRGCRAALRRGPDGVRALGAGRPPTRCRARAHRVVASAPAVRVQRRRVTARATANVRPTRPGTYQGGTLAVWHVLPATL